MTNVTLNGIKVLKQDHSEFSKVPRKLGVLRWKFLDVRTRRSTSSKFGRSFRGVFRRIPGELGVEVVSGDLRGFRDSFRLNHGELGVVQGGDRHDALMCGAREFLDELQVQESQRCGDYEEFSGVLTDWTKLGLTFGLKQDHSEFSKVPRKLGVLRWKFLDVRTRRSTSSKFGRSFRGVFRRIPGELGVEVVSGDLRGFRDSFRLNHGELGVVQGGDRHDALMCGAREFLDELQVQESQRCGDYEEFSGVLTDWTKLGLTFGYIKL
ncbi:hypothetical protein ACFX1T_022667 [Malus domestica]